MSWLILAGVILGPLLLARVRHLPPAPGGIVVRPDAPVLDMEVVVANPGAAGLVQQRPQPKVISDDDTGEANAVVRIEPGVALVSPEALDRIAAQLEHTPSIAVHPWRKTAKRVESFDMFRVLLDAMSSGAFAVVPLRSSWTPTALTAQTRATTARPVVFGGGYVVARSDYGRADGRYSVVAATIATLFFGGAIAAFVGLVLNPSWATLGVYAAYVLSISLCLRQVGKFARLSAAVYPLVFVAGVVRGKNTLSR